MRVAILLVAAAGAAVVSAQSPDRQSLSFEVASIKRNNSGTGFITMGMQPGGRLNLVNVTVRNLITRAYGVQPFQVIGAPDWTANDRFDVLAKAEGDATPEQVNLMLRTLLAERFKLVARQETRDQPVYYLVKARADGQPGPDLKPAAIDCGPTGRGRPGGAPAGRGTGPAPGPGGTAGCRMTIAFGRLEAGGQPVGALATMLANQVGRPIVDKSGLTGNYDFTLSWLPDAGRGAAAGPLPPGAPAPPPVDPDAPSLFTAVQEQLGLKLESGRGPVEVVVVDSVEQPTED